MKKDILHLKAPGNWINDPNGFIYYQGKYHLFYQYFPYAPVWGTMHWGHAVSDNLIYWEHQGVALFPTKEYDQNGVFSGSSLEVNGRLQLYYSAVRYLEKNSENIHMAVDGRFVTSQAMVISEDGFKFDNWKNKKQILPVSEDEKKAHPTHTRDPKVWKNGNMYYMALGSTVEEKIGRVLFYQSKDSMQWEYVNQYCDNRFGNILECPDIFQVKDKWIFMGSCMNIDTEDTGYPHHAMYGIADFDLVSCEMGLTEDFRPVDYGGDLYAAQTNLDEEGRRVMIAWMRMPGPVKDASGMEWNGMMCLPRVIDIENDVVYFRIHPRVKEFFNTKIPFAADFNREEALYLQLALDEGQSVTIGGVKIWRQEGKIIADRSAVYSGEGTMKASGPKITGECQLDIFLDGQLIEIFGNNGEFVLSFIVNEFTDEFEADMIHSEIQCCCHKEYKK